MDDRWILAMQEEIDQFQKNNVWKLVSPPNDKSVIGTIWIFRIELDENCKEGIDFTTTFALVARLEVICILLSFTTHHSIILHQMDVKCTFLKGIINEDVFVKQPSGFERYFSKSCTLWTQKQCEEPLDYHNIVSLVGHNCFTHINSQVVKAIARYSTSALERTTIFCFLLFQETTFPPIHMQKPVVDRLSMGDRAQLAS
ncbi:hypothetical protein CR513_00058, partial [Mucuna pruriens]